MTGAHNQPSLRSRLGFVASDALSLALLGLALVAALTRVFGWGGSWVVILAVLLAVAAFANGVWDRIIEPRRKRRRESAERLKRLEESVHFWPPPTVESVTNEELFAAGMVRRPHIPASGNGESDRETPYVPRTIDQVLRDRLGRASRVNGALVTLVGQSARGKSRSLWEALRATLPNRRVVAVKSSRHAENPIRSIIDGLAEHIHHHDRGPIIVLDDVHEHIRRRTLGADELSSLQSILPDSVIVATAVERELLKLDDIGSGVSDTLRHGANSISWPAEMDEAETHEAIAAYPFLEDHPWRSRLPELLSSVPAWVREYDLVQASDDITATVVDIAAGLSCFDPPAGISHERLRSIVAKHLAARMISHSRETIDAAIVAAVSTHPIDAGPDADSKWAPPLINSSFEDGADRYTVRAEFIDWLDHNQWEIPIAVWDAELEQFDDRESLAGAVRVDPTGAERAVALGDWRSEKGDLDRAADLYQLAIDSDHPDHKPAAADALGLVRKTQGRPEAAQVAFQLAIDSDHPDHKPAAAVHLGEVRAQQGDLDGAADLYQLAIDSDHPDHKPAAAVHLGEVRTQQGDLDGAADLYQLAIDSDHPDYKQAAANSLGLVRKTQGKWDAAEAAFQLAIEGSSPDQAAAAAMNLADLCIETGADDRAAALLQSAVDADHSFLSVMAAYKLGMLQRDRREFEAAARSYQLAISAEDAFLSPRAAWELGGLYKDEGEAEKAATAYKIAVDYDDDEYSALAAAAAGLMLHNLGEYVEAHDLVEIAIRASDPSARALGWLVRAEQLRGRDYQGHEDALRNSADINDPQYSMQSAYSLAIMLRSEGREAEAMAYWSLLMNSSNPNHRLEAELALRLDP